MNKFETSQKWAANFGEMEFSMKQLLMKAKARGIVDVIVRPKEVDPLYPRIQMTRENGNILLMGIPAGDPESLRVYLAGYLAGFDQGVVIQ